MATLNSPTTPEKLGNLIFKENPYLNPPKRSTRILPDCISIEAVDEDEDPNTDNKEQRRRWRFLDKESKEHGVSYALRIRYSFIKEDGKKECHYILIGFSGGAGE